MFRINRMELEDVIKPKLSHYFEYYSRNGNDFFNKQRIQEENIAIKRELSEIEKNISSFFTTIKKKESPLPTIKKVIFNYPATIVIWEDGTKTIVKVQNGESFDEEKGLALCLIKKITGNTGGYNEIFKKWTNQ